MLDSVATFRSPDRKLPYFVNHSHPSTHAYQQIHRSINQPNQSIHQIRPTVQIKQLSRSTRSTDSLANQTKPNQPTKMRCTTLSILLWTTHPQRPPKPPPKSSRSHSQRPKPPSPRPQPHQQPIRARFRQSPTSNNLRLLPTTATTTTTTTTARQQQYRKSKRNHHRNEQRPSQASFLPRRQIALLPPGTLGTAASRARERAEMLRRALVRLLWRLRR